MNYEYVEVAAAVPYVRVADCYYNTSRIKEMILQVEKLGVEILTIPELFITGYMCGDLFHQSFLLDQVQKAFYQPVEEMTEADVMVIVGMPVKVEEKLFNGAVTFQYGKILGAIPKTYLPNYREFQEKRWFSPSDPLQYKTMQMGSHTVPIGCNVIFRCGRVGIGIEIYEDMWTPFTPGTRLSLYGTHIIFNLSASNENAGKHDYLYLLISGATSQSICEHVYTSSGYGRSSTDLVYTGKVFTAEVSKIVKEMRRFKYKERMIVSDIDVSRIHGERLINNNFKSAVSHFTDREELESIPFTLCPEVKSQPMSRVMDRNPFMPEGTNPEERCHKMFQVQVCGLIQRLKHIRAEHAVIDISGGLGSALALLVTAEAFDFLGLGRKQIIAVTVPDFGTSEHTYRNSYAMMQALSVTIHEIDIKEATEQHLLAIDYKGNREDATFENAQARECTQILMDLANIYHVPVIGTGDLSGVALRWCTFNGDHMSMYTANSGITKTSVQLIVGWYATHRAGDTSLATTLQDIVATPISPELLPIKDTKTGNEQQIQNLVGPYGLHGFFIYHFLLDSLEPKKTLYLAKVAFEGAYTPQEIKHWVGVFFKRFSSQQFKRNTMSDGPKVLSVSLSSCEERRMSGDAVSSMRFQEAENLETQRRGR